MSPLERDAYVQEMSNADQYDNSYGQIQYTLANLALTEARSMVMQAEEPSVEMINGIAHRLESAAVANEGTDALIEKRALMLGAFLKPLIWAELISTNGLSDSEAKRVSQRLGLKQANDTLAKISKDSLCESNLLTKGRSVRELDAEEYKQYAGLRGFLQEATVVLLGNRTNTAKMLVLPTLQFEDALQSNRKTRADGTLFDNRKIDVTTRKHAYQVKSTYRGEEYNYTIPLVHGNMLGNNQGEGSWGTKPYTTLRNLLHEREGYRLDPDVSSRLDKVWGEVRNTIMQTNKPRLAIPTPAQIRR